MNDPADRYDYIVVGGGSAGCVLARRLTDDGRSRVLLLEAGEDDAFSLAPGRFMPQLKVRIPAGFAHLMGDPRVAWQYASEPDANMGGRVHKFPRGKMLGGSSAINGLAYVRGMPTDFDGWRQLGCTGWAWADVEPLFRRFENMSDADGRPAPDGGELAIDRFPERYASADIFLQACVEAGLKPQMDLNRECEEGMDYSRQTTRRGIRQTTSVAFLRPVRHRPNLRVETRALAEKVLMDGKAAVGVRYRQNGRTVDAAARCEVILCGGVINSPQLLQLSGIGDPQHLASIGVASVAANREVGRNFQDHYGVSLQLRLKPGSQSINASSRGLGLAWELARFALRRRGTLAGASVMVTGYLRSSPAADIPDIQAFASPGNIDYEATARSGRVVLGAEPGFTISGYPARPQSCGSVLAKSPDPAAHPAIRPELFTAAYDQMVTVAMIRRMDEIVRQPAMSRIVQGYLPPMSPAMIADDEALVQFARDFGFSTYHGSGTCRMGGDEASVVDPQLRVRGVANLRVADASVMPRLISGNTNAACIMIGEKAAELLATARQESQQEQVAHV